MFCYLDQTYEYYDTTNSINSLSRNRYYSNINGTDSGVSIELNNEYCFHVNTTQVFAQYHREQWYQNGENINHNNNLKYNSTVSIKQNGELQFSIKISNVSFDDLGDYIGVISTDIYDLTLWCSEYRYSFIPGFLVQFYSRLPAVLSLYSIELYSKYTCSYMQLNK